MIFRTQLATELVRQAAVALELAWPQAEMTENLMLPSGPLVSAGSFK